MRNGILFGLVALALASTAHAQTVPMLIPYQGMLERDGALVNAIDSETVDFRVSLYNAPVDGTKVWPAGEGVFDEHSVNVYNGRFAFLIGSDQPYVHVANTPLYLDIQIKTADDADFVPLAGRQLLASAPYSVASARSDVDFQVPGLLSVGTSGHTSDVTISGDGNLGGGIPEWLNSGQHTGTAIHWGSDNAFFGMKNRGAGGSSEKDAVVYFGDDADDNLIFENLVGGVLATFQGDNRSVFHGDVQVDGNLDVNPPMFAYEVFRSLSPGEYNTGMPTDEWFAMVAGFSAENADFNETGVHAVLMRVRMWPVDGTWRIQMEVPTHDSTVESWQVSVLFIRRYLVHYR